MSLAVEPLARPCARPSPVVGEDVEAEEVDRDRHVAGDRRVEAQRAGIEDDRLAVLARSDGQRVARLRPAIGDVDHILAGREVEGRGRVIGLRRERQLAASYRSWYRRRARRALRGWPCRSSVIWAVSVTGCGVEITASTASTAVCGRSARWQRASSRFGGASKPSAACGRAGAASGPGRILREGAGRGASGAPRPRQDLPSTTRKTTTSPDYPRRRQRAHVMVH